MADLIEPEGDPGGAGRRLRESLEPPAGAVERVVRQSLAAKALGRDQGLAREAGRPDHGLAGEERRQNDDLAGGGMRRDPSPALALRDHLLAGESDCLDQPPAGPLLPGQRLAAALALALLLAAGLWLVYGRPGPGPRHEPAAVSITNVGDIVVARSAGRVHIVRSSPAGQPRPAGISFIRYGGGE